ncbi:alpha/beta hydrolase [Sphingomonas piscis]|uniref:alpha/beta hydrolase n=1 Tax=Sphingomonas piscis TaxID=2714943 RepID=UPI001FE2EF39|nr:alpha/beta fold hydrolase [Sphingomonas piscis]
MQFRVLVALSLAAATIGGLTSASAQVATQVPDPVPGAKKVTLQRIKVHSAALEGNLEGNSADRDVIVVLPPSYASSPRRRYPVVYALHGYSIGAEQWIKEIHVPQTVEGAFAKGTPEVIVVLPDSKTVHNGSMYSRSPTTGDFETFVARDLVAYVDKNFRTLPRRESRGLVGHSMGGYGATRIGMNHSDVFGALYVMSGCCLSPRSAGGLTPELLAKLKSVKSIEEAQKLGWMERATLASASAWSPDPANAPLFLDLPSGQDGDDVVARWAANSPLAFFDQHVADLRRYKAISVDVGDKDGLKADAEKLHQALNRYKIAHGYEVYPGDHTSAVAVRFQEYVMPFFGRNLAFQ